MLEVKANMVLTIGVDLEEDKVSMDQVRVVVLNMQLVKLLWLLTHLCINHILLPEKQILMQKVPIGELEAVMLHLVEIQVMKITIETKPSHRFEVIMEVLETGDKKQVNKIKMIKHSQTGVKMMMGQSKMKTKLIKPVKHGVEKMKS